MYLNFLNYYLSLLHLKFKKSYLLIHIKNNLLNYNDNFVFINEG